MSREQSTQTFDTAKSENATNFGNSQNSYVKTQEDIGDYGNQLSKYAAGDPFAPGGDFQTAENKVLSGIAGGVADSARAELESSGARRGQNTALADAEASSIADKSQRTLAGEEGTAEAQRVGHEADYKKSVLDATRFPVQAESDLYRDTSGSADRELSTAGSAAAGNHSFGDVFGSAFADSLGKSFGSISYRPTGG